jgi:exodeoxyribonuclease VII large subunit
MLEAGAPSFIRVSQVARYLKELVETDDFLQEELSIAGEISGCKTYPSGHCYFTLKDEAAQLSCVFFKQARLRSAAPTLRDGMLVQLTGRFSFYERDGKLQCYVDSVQSMGREGALYLKFEQLKSRLAEEGLFDEARKRALPPIPATIGIVTSPQAAALRDILRVLTIRFPLAQVIFAPTLVQGAEAPAAIAAAIDLLNEHGEADVMIVGRGGGSIEELWAFNEEIVARAIARSRIPVISGVGHETDFTIADLVADHRASTPTAAATAAVPDMTSWQAAVLEKQSQLQDLITDRLEDLKLDLERVEYDLQRAHPRSILDRRRQQLDDLTESLQMRMEHLLSLRKERLQGMALNLHSLSPLQTIARGYSVVRREPEQQLVSQIKQVQEGDRLTIRVVDGQIQARVTASQLLEADGAQVDQG